MQFLAYMVVLQIKFPFNLKGFIKFQDVSFGRVDFIEAYIPSFSLLVVDKDELTSDYSTYQEFFNSHDVEEPYFIIVYTRGIAICLIIGFGFIPGLFILMKLSQCWKLERLEKIPKNMLSSFKYNTPLRAFLEVYLDLMLVCLLNATNVIDLLLIV